VFVFIHGGNWRRGMAKDYGFPAEMFVAAGAHYAQRAVSQISRS